MILEVSGVSLFYGANAVLTDVTFQINEGDRVGLTGYNGCGKTTLLNIITGELDPTGGFVVLKNNATVGYLKQTSGLDPRNTVMTEMRSVNNADLLLSRMKELERTMGTDHDLIAEYESVCEKYDAMDGYNLEYNIKKILNGMSFPADTWDKKVSVLSGGEKTRLSLAKLLIMDPDLLILDEPTNHLDLTTLEWLEDFIKSRRNSVLVVSHDRYFLDAVTTKTLEIQNGKSKMYPGNFSVYTRLKKENDEREQEVYRQTTQEAEKLRDYAQRNIVRASTSNMAKSRLKMLSRLDLTAPDEAAHDTVKITIEPRTEPYKEVLTVQDLGVCAGGTTLVEELNFTVFRGERLAIIGANGTGKTTLIKTLLGQQHPASGRFRIGGGVQTGYLEQNLFRIRSKTPFDYIRDLYPMMTQLEIRSLLASVGFRGEDVFTESSGLSGGEAARLNLARLILERPNLLILDEPTNHLDIYTKDVLCESLKSYAGTIILVTHDRYLMEHLGCRLLLLEDKKGVMFENYTAYRAFAAGDVAVPAPPVSQNTTQSKDEQKASPASSKDARRERAKERERKSFLDKRIQELEISEYELESDIASPENASDHLKLADMCEQLEKVKAELDELMTEWLECYGEE